MFPTLKFDLEIRVFFSSFMFLTNLYVLQDSDGEKSDTDLVVDDSNEVSSISVY